MKYDFDHTPDHRHNGSYRWNMADMPEDVIGMGTADLDYFCAPCIREALLPIAEENCFNYRQRPERYYDAVIGFYKRNYGLTVQKEWLSNVPSTIGAVRMALGIYAKPGDAVIVQTPLFNPISWAIESADLQEIDNPMKIVDGHYEIDFEDFEQKIKEHHPKLYLMVNPHNPTGRVFTEEEMRRLLNICYENGVLFLSDEVHALVIYEGARFIPLLALGEKAQEIGIQIVSFSKGFNIMSLPHAIVTIADPDLQVAWMRQIRGFSFGYATNSFSIAAVTAILEGQGDEWLKELTAYLYGNLQEILRFIKEEKLPFKCYVPEGSFLLWIDCREAGIGTRNLDRVFMEKTKIHLDDGVDNFGPEGEGFVRINFAVTRTVLKEALERIRSAFQQ